MYIHILYVNSITIAVYSSSSSAYPIGRQVRTNHEGEGE